MGKSVREFLGLLNQAKTAFTRLSYPSVLPKAQTGTSGLKNSIDYVHETRKAIKSQGPSWLARLMNPDANIRYRASMDTFNTSTDRGKFKALREQAESNLARWKTKATPLSHHEVTVTPHDWSQDAHVLCKETGAMPAVLTNASAEIPGGAFPMGSAQEEELFRVTTASRYLQHAFNPMGDVRMHFDPKQGCFRYTPEERRLIIGATPMTERELEILRERSQRPIEEGAFKVYLHERPIICFKGPDIRFKVDDLQAYPAALKSGYILDTGSYKLLNKESIFPFRDLVAAAPNLADDAITLPRHKGGADIPADWSCPRFLQAYEEDMGRRVAAILDTLIVNGNRTAVIPPIGCGAYKNNPSHVARIFRDKIHQRPNCFDSLFFSVKTGPGLEEANYREFKDILDGMPLHKEGKPFSFFSPDKKTPGTPHLDKASIEATGFTKKT